MFERHFGLRENPFHSGHQLRFLYPSREHQEARAHLRFGIENREAFVLITGEVGTGKTTALYDALAEWGSQVAVALITNSALTRQELIEEIGLRFGVSVPPGASKPQALVLLERHLNAVRARGEHAVLLLDEAQNLKPELLEEIRLLSNLEAQGEKLVQIFLVGQPELEVLLGQPQLRQLRQRIGVHYRLNPLSPEETTAYIHHRVAVAGGNPFATFPSETCREVYRITHGIPREINTVASQAMIAAFSEGAATVQPTHVRESSHESEFQSVLGGPSTEISDVPESPAAVVLRESVIVPTPTAAPEPSAPPAAPVTSAPPEAPTHEPPAPPPVRDTTPMPWPATAAEPAHHPPVEPNLAVQPAAPATAPPTAPERVPEPQPGPAPPPASAPEPEPAHAWTPPEFEVAPVAPPPPPPPLAAPPVSHPATAAPPAEHEQVIDAWTAAAKELLAARRRAQEADRVAVVAHEPHAEPRIEPATPTAPRFPSPDELVERAERARPQAADLSGLPERLRAKIAADIAAEEAREAQKRRLLPALLGFVAVVALAVAAILLQRFQVIDVPALRAIAGTAGSDTTKRVAAAASAPAPRTSGAGASLGATRDSASMPPRPPVAARPSASITPASATPGGGSARAAANPAVPPRVASMSAPPPGAGESAPRPPTRTPVTTPTLPAAASPASSVPATAGASAGAAVARPDVPAARADSSVYCLGVAAYLDRDRAEQEREKLAASSGLPATVVPFNDAGTTKFRVTIGHYASYAAAERAALDLMTRLNLSEATPLLLSRGRAR